MVGRTKLLVASILALCPALLAGCSDPADAGIAGRHVSDAGLAGRPVSDAGIAGRHVSDAGPAPRLGKIPAGMVLMPGGSFRMGNEGGHDDEAAEHQVTIHAFLLDSHEVTNRRFAKFVDETGHVTTAEHDGYAWGYLKGERAFRKISGASWRRPGGDGTSIEALMDHPVVCVSWHDARAFAKWSGKRLPTEAEWEYASRGGSSGHFRADIHQTGGTRLVAANVWEGTWPEKNLKADGFFYTAPVGSYARNEFGIADMIGNVWEWCSDWYSPDTYRHGARKNPVGPKTGEKRVARGGSWFCSAGYCSAYSTHYRGASPPDHSFNNVGFRCAADPSPRTGNKSDA